MEKGSRRARRASAAGGVAGVQAAQRLLQRRRPLLLQRRPRQQRRRRWSQPCPQQRQCHTPHLVGSRTAAVTLCRMLPMVPGKALRRQAVHIPMSVPILMISSSRLPSQEASQGCPTRWLHNRCLHNSRCRRNCSMRTGSRLRNAVITRMRTSNPMHEGSYDSNHIIACFCGLQEVNCWTCAL